MSPHKADKEAEQRIPLILRGSDISLLLRLKHKLENDTNKTVKTSDIIRRALRELAVAHNIIDCR